MLYVLVSCSSNKGVGLTYIYVVDFEEMCSGCYLCLLCGCQYLHSAATEIYRNLEQAQDSNDWNKVCTYAYGCGVVAIYGCSCVAL